MLNEFRGCWTCARTAMLCPHRVATIPYDGTVCPSGYGKEVSRRQTADGSQTQAIPLTASAPTITLPPTGEETKKRPRKIKTERKGLTPEKRREMSERAKAKWNALSPEEQQAHKDKIAAGKKKGLTSM